MSVSIKMELLSKIKLSRLYGKVIYVTSAILSVAMAALVIFSPLAIPVCVIIKMLSMPVIYYLNLQLSNESVLYFYLNLGISKREYHLIPFIIEFCVFMLLMVITGAIGYVIW